MNPVRVPVPISTWRLLSDCRLQSQGAGAGIQFPKVAKVSKAAKAGRSLVKYILEYGITVHESMLKEKIYQVWQKHR